MEIKACKFNRRIPAFYVKEKLFIRIEEKKYITLYPVSKDCKSLEEANKEIKSFGKEIGFPATMTTEEEWDELIKVCQEKGCLKEFIQLNDINQNSVVNATNMISSGIVFRAGPGNLSNDKYYKCWSQIFAPILVFATIEIS